MKERLQKLVVKYKEDYEDGFVNCGNLYPNNKAEYEKNKQIRNLEEEIAILNKL